MSLRADHLGIRVGDRWLIRGIDLELRPGRLCVLLGGNGAGKSTLLRAFSGDSIPAAGASILDRQPLSSWKAQALARRRAVLTQHDNLRFSFSAAEVVALAHLPWAGARDRHADAIDDAALAAAHASAFAQRRYTELSGGERARVRFARCLAQVWERPDAWLLLDEPVAHLDFAHRHRCMVEARRQAGLGLGVLVVLHDPNLAAAYADDVALLRDGELTGFGPTASILTPEHLSAVYDTAIVRSTDDGGHAWFHAAD